MARDADDDNYSWYTSPNRYLCSCFEEMRSAIKGITCPITKRTLKALVEEAQTLGNRMEAALNDARDLQEGRKILSKMKKDHKQLKQEIEELRKEKELLKDN